ncbi:MAG: DinB family protein [Acidobacteriota bacterium]|nr:DinB family protein [Acidobacteriota bacterium]MDH3530357.1 DinB family protein [Acidobacteriota bacterium]
MDFEIEKATEILRQTPATLSRLLEGLSEEWTTGESGRDSWNAFDVVGHLIHGEKTDWIPRARIILAHGENKTFVPFDRFAQFEDSKGKSLAELLEEFAKLRGENLQSLSEMRLTDEKLDLKGIHPELGEVTLRELLATWVVHDLNHTRQIVTSLAKRYEGNVGAWQEYLSILQLK